MKKNLVLPVILGVLVSMASNASYAELQPSNNTSAPAFKMLSRRCCTVQQATPPSLETLPPGMCQNLQPKNGKPGFNDEKKRNDGKKRQELDNRLNLAKCNSTGKRNSTQEEKESNLLWKK
jgi:hypothetical protein